MTDIFCSAENCAHNKDKCCCLTNIHVGGQNARNCDATCCDNFIKQHATMQIGECACHHTVIDCDAHNCVHNCHGECNAQNIDVRGESSCTCTETACETFRNGR